MATLAALVAMAAVRVAGHPVEKVGEVASEARAGRDKDCASARGEGLASDPLLLRSPRLLPLFERVRSHKTSQPST